ncbi:MAG TPA: aminoglycoside phosphotransferase family protein [Blastocatellia bacterium]|nr:aminoglycoside phosphotransferase family protein [Blastocatellia bacterium]
MEPDWRQIERENRGLSVRSAHFLGEGWNSLAYLVNDEFVFRFPKRLEHWKELEREVTFLAFAADLLPLAVPRYMRIAPGSPASAYGYAVYRYLHGHAMNVNALSQEKRDAAAEVIGAFLRELHSLQLSPEVSYLLPREDERMVAEGYFVRAQREIAPKLRPLEASALIKQFEIYLGSPENFLFQPTVLHADLSRDHILLENDSVTAVIDFGDVNWGDPDYDFMYLFVDFGQSFAEEVARRYGHQDLERLLSKLLYFGLVDQIGTILDGEGLALEGQEDEAWLRLKQLLRRCTVGA